MTAQTTWNPRSAPAVWQYAVAEVAGHRVDRARLELAAEDVHAADSLRRRW